MNEQITKKQMRSLFEKSAFTIHELGLGKLEPSMSVDFTKEGMNFYITVPESDERVDIFSCFHFMSLQNCQEVFDIAIAKIKERDLELCQATQN